MLTITAQQADTLHKDLRRRFVDRMVVHIRQYFPRQFDRLGESVVREWIEHGIQRSGQYGIISERDVCKYIDVMMVFGREFDKDPNCAWAPPILNAQPTDPNLKTERLFQTARQKAIAGNRNPNG